MSTSLSRRTLIGTGLAFGLIGTLDACTSSGTGAGEARGKTVTYWNNFQDNSQFRYFQNVWAAGYPGPGKAVIVNKPSATIDRLIQAALAAGSGPDVIETPGPSTGTVQYTKAGYLVDLDKYIERYHWDKVFVPWALEASRIHGRLMTLPTQYESMAFYYNPRTLSKLALDPPKNQDEFENYCESAVAHKLIPIAAGNADWKGANEWHMGVALNQGAGPEAIYSALRGEVKWTDPTIVSAVERYTNYFKKGWFGGSVAKYFTNHFPTLYRQLAIGDAAGMISGTWDFSNMAPYFGKAAGNNETWDWSMLPSLGQDSPEGVWDLAIGQSNGVNSHSKDVGAAVSFLNFMTTDKKLILKSVRDQSAEPSPIHVSVSDFPSGTDPRTIKLYTELSASTKVGYTTWTFFPPKTETYIINDFENVITGKMTASQYCTGIQDAFVPELKAGLVPAIPKPGTVVNGS